MFANAAASPLPAGVHAGPAPLVALRGVSRQFRRAAEITATLEASDLTVPAGDFLALAGPSGSGKSTLLSLLCGLDRPDAGTITVAGRRIDGMGGRATARWRARHIGLVFQRYRLLPALSAERNVELPLTLAGLSRTERWRRAQAALDLAGIAAARRREPAALSDEQARRVCIARAIVTNPALLLCDEPTGDLDRAAGDGILALLRLLNREHGKTIVMVTRDRHTAARADRTLYLDNGRLTEEPAGRVH